jgi:hypothetical protein
MVTASFTWAQVVARDITPVAIESGSISYPLHQLFDGFVVQKNRKTTMIFQQSAGDSGRAAAELSGKRVKLPLLLNAGSRVGSHATPGL